MHRKSIETNDILDNIIIGHVEPSIYAFITNTFPNYLKIGDTYRPVDLRIKEWKKIYPDLVKKFEESATINNDIYFRDFSVHKYLETELNKKRLTSYDMGNDGYYSKEFFLDTDIKDVQDGINDIKNSYNNNIDKYNYYKSVDHLPATYQFKREEKWYLRPNQKEVVQKFLEAYNNGRNNLLMYAVMRFGKSFTSLYCGLEIGANVIVIVSAKADVQMEWKKTVESAGNFKGYKFLNSSDLDYSSTILKDTLKKNKIVLFLTLQDLQGDIIKNKHKQVFECDIDLLIIDETHFGARAHSYGTVLREKKKDEKNINRLKDEFIAQEDADTSLKYLKAKIKIHLSGTPYRILLGNEFGEEDIISFVQFTDIVKAKEEWDNKNLYKDNINEWDNPYFGVPQMIRFAFKPNKKSLEKLEELKTKGINGSLSNLLSPKSIKKDEFNNHLKFIYEENVLNLLKAIDGSETDKNIFPFLDYKKIQDGEMCRHLVLVLPFCASCDAMEELLKKNSKTFKHLNDYEIINISGLNAHKIFKKPVDIKNAIKKNEKLNKKTITLTVNRMLTGSTIEEWDTMIFLKDTNSPQEYDQAIFRIQNQYVRTLSDGQNTIKENMKPQTLLVDFDPNRLFKLQEQKSLILNIYSNKTGNDNLHKKIEQELKVSPIITMNENQLQQVTATNILEYISEYNNSRSIAEETEDIPVDYNLLNDKLIHDVISRQSDFKSNSGLTFETYNGEGQEFDLDYEDVAKRKDKTVVKDSENQYNTNSERDMYNFEKKFKTYYQRILMYSFLIEDKVNSLNEVVDSLINVDNQRILFNLGLNLDVLKAMANSMDYFVRNALDYKIQNISRLANDESKTPLERSLISLNKFNRISDSEVITPETLCDEMISKIPIEGLKKIIENNKMFLDVASKSGEFSVSIYKKLISIGFTHDEIKNKIYAIPTSSIAYELTRKFYKLLDLNTNNISSKFNSYNLVELIEKSDLDYKSLCDLINQKMNFNDIKLKYKNAKENEEMKFGAIMGNPPYNISDGGAQASSKPIYQHFVMLAEHLEADFSTFIIPTRWYSGGKGLELFRNHMINSKHIVELYDITTPEDIFPGTNNRGGVCYFITDKNKKSLETNIYTMKNNKLVSKSTRPLKMNNLDIFIRDSIGIEIINKINKVTNSFISDEISSLRPFGFRGYFIKSENYHSESDSLITPILCYGKGKKIGYVERELITKNTEYIDSWKVFIPRANNIATELHDDNLNSFIGKPKEICTETYLMVGAGLNLNYQSSYNITKYFKTKFGRYLHSLAKSSHDSTAKTFRFVPLENFEENSDIDWDRTIKEIDKQLFDKYKLSVLEIDHINASIKDM